MRKLSFGYIGTVALLSLTLAGYSLSDRGRPDFLARPLDTIDKQIAGWNMTNDEPLETRVLDRLRLSSYISRRYEKRGMKLGLFIAFYAQQRAGESMHSPKHCLPGSGWEIWKHGSAVIPVDGRPVEINQYYIQNSGQRMVVFYWYQSRRRIIASEYMGKVLLVRDALLDGRTAGLLARIIVPDVPEAPAEGIAFATALVPEVQRCFGETN